MRGRNRVSFCLIRPLFLGSILRCFRLERNHRLDRLFLSLKSLVQVTVNIRKTGTLKDLDEIEREIINLNSLDTDTHGFSLILIN